MKNILTIIKKELKRVFGDKRLILSVFILPGLMIYILYSVMGTAMQSITNEAEKENCIIYAVNMPTEIKNILDLEELAFKYQLTSVTVNDIEKYKQEILDETADYLIVFPSNFISEIANNNSPNVDTYYNPVNDKSSLANSKIQFALTSYKEKIIYDELGSIFTINESNEESLIMNENKAVAKSFALLLPFLIITFLFSGAMAVGPESIAGEKERGTIATLLVTPVSRSQIALGKIFSLTITCTLSAISSFIGIIASLPKLMGLSGSGVSANIYGFSEYVTLFFIVISTVLVFIGIISLVSAYAKNIKEASVLVLPLMIISMLIGITTMFSSSANQNWYMYFIPIFNSVHAMMGIFSFEFNVTHFIITICTNALIVCAAAYALTKMFNSEKIMFSK